MEFRGRHHRKVISRVIIQCDDVHNDKPERDGAPVTTQYDGPQEDRHQIGEEVFKRMTVDGSDCDGCLQIQMG